MMFRAYTLSYIEFRRQFISMHPKETIRIRSSMPMSSYSIALHYGFSICREIERREEKFGEINLFSLSPIIHWKRV